MKIILNFFTIALGIYLGSTSPIISILGKPLSIALAILICLSLLSSIRITISEVNHEKEGEIKWTNGSSVQDDITRYIVEQTIKELNSKK